eukprot:jgi/Phyca11/21480/fgenesh1_pg.PHYCAscaffold_97_\
MPNASKNSDDVALSAKRGRLGNERLKYDKSWNATATGTNFFSRFFASTTNASPAARDLIFFAAFLTTIAWMLGLKQKPGNRSFTCVPFSASNGTLDRVNAIDAADIVVPSGAKSNSPVMRIRSTSFSFSMSCHRSSDCSLKFVYVSIRFSRCSSDNVDSGIPNASTPVDDEDDDSDVCQVHEIICRS